MLTARTRIGSSVVENFRNIERSKVADHKKSVNSPRENTYGMAYWITDVFTSVITSSDCIPKEGIFLNFKPVWRMRNRRIESISCIPDLYSFPLEFGVCGFPPVAAVFVKSETREQGDEQSHGREKRGRLDGKGRISGGEE